MLVIRFIFLIMTIFLQGCVAYNSKLMESDTYSESSSYLYGALYIKGSGTREALGAGIEIIDNRNGNVFNFEFEKKYNVMLAKIPPGNYSITRIVFTNSLGKEKREQIVKNMHFTLKEGQVAYFGDLLVTTGNIVARDSTYFRSAWKFEGVLNNYQDVTAYLVNKHPSFQSALKTNNSTLWHTRYHYRNLTSDLNGRKTVD